VTLPDPLVEEAPEMPDPVTRGGLLAILSSERMRSTFQHPLLAQLLLSWFWCMFAFVMLEIIFPLFLKEKFGFGPRGVGLFFGLAGITIVVVQGVLIGRLTKRFGEWPIVIAGPALVAIAMGLLVQVSSTPLLPLLLLAGLLNAVGRSLMMPSMSSLLSKTAPSDRQGAVFGLFHGLGSLARVFGPILAGVLFERGAALPFVAAGIIATLVTVWMALLRGRYGERRGFEVLPASAASEPTRSA
jgi:MFS family permease